MAVSEGDRSPPDTMAWAYRWRQCGPMRGVGRGRSGERERERERERESEREGEREGERERASERARVSTGQGKAATRKRVAGVTHRRIWPEVLQ